jgi:hypothetical protein
MVMPSNSSAMVTGYMAGRYPRRLGWLMSPEGWRSPHPWLPYALDNGAFSAYRHSRPWDEAAFYRMLERAKRSANPPLWVLCPDKVARKEETLELWEQHSPRITEAGYLPAFAVQNDMEPSDVPAGAGVVFVGGTFDWKWATLTTWTSNFPRVHVGRVNTERLLWLCHNAGAESCDGTGWMRGDKKQLAGLFNYLRDSNNLAMALLT